MTNLKPTYGVISESYHFAMDGEFCSGYSEENVVVTKYWGKGSLENYPKELTTSNGTIYRHTRKNGWRQYYKISNKFKTYTGLGSTRSFVPNKKKEHQNWNKVNLGNW